MPKVLRILNRLIVGGPVLNATYLTKYLAPEFETLLVVGEKEEHEKSASYLAEQLGVEYITIPEMGRSLNVANDYKAYKKISKIIEDFKPDIVHTHAAKSGALGRLAASNLQVPAIVHTYHGHVFHSYFNSLSTRFFVNTERFLARKSHAIVAISEAQKKELVHDFRIAPAHKFRVIPLGFNLDKFQTDQEIKRKQFRTEFNVADDEIAIGIIGRLVPVKNHTLFIRALSYLLKNTNKKVKAFIVGGGETRESLQAVASEAGIPYATEKDPAFLAPLVFTSWRSDIDVITAGLDIVALTSLNEGTPVSLIEAQAANKPIVSTRVGGISDIVHENETALLADLNDPQLFSDHLLRLVQDDELRHQLGKFSSNYVMERFSYQRLVSDTAALYNELLSKKITGHAVLR